VTGKQDLGRHFGPDFETLTEAYVDLKTYNRIPMVMLRLLAGGSSASLTISEESLKELGLREGDILYLTKAADGSIRASSRDPAIERQMAIAELAMCKDRDLLSALSE
jgi:antitoxin component of MazEF toxin-antitoxin module